MTTRSLLLTSALLLAGLGCRDDTQSPTEAGPALAEAPELAVASNTWITRANMPSDRFDLTTAVVPNAAGQSILYAIGGRPASSSAGLSKVQAYNVVTNSWSAKAPLPVPLWETNGATVIDGKIYVAGGRSSYYRYRADLYVYDPATNTWTRKRDMPNSGVGGVSAAIDGRLYVLTSCQHDDYCYPGTIWPTLYRYHPGTDRWTVLPSVPPPGRFGGATAAGVVGGKLYLADVGWKTLWMYDPAGNQWTNKGLIPFQYGMEAGATLRAKLYLFGGDLVNNVSWTLVYDPATAKWSSKAPMPTVRSDFAASKVFVNGKPRIEVVGGGRPGNNLQYVP